MKGNLSVDKLSGCDDFFDNTILCDNSLKKVVNELALSLEELKKYNMNLYTSFIYYIAFNSITNFIICNTSNMESDAISDLAKFMLVSNKEGIRDCYNELEDDVRNDNFDITLISDVINYNNRENVEVKYFSDIEAFYKITARDFKKATNLVVSYKPSLDKFISYIEYLIKKVQEYLKL